MKGLWLNCILHWSLSLRKGDGESSLVNNYKEIMQAPTDHNAGIEKHVLALRRCGVCVFLLLNPSLSSLWTPVCRLDLGFGGIPPRDWSLLFWQAAVLQVPRLGCQDTLDSCVCLGIWVQYPLGHCIIDVTAQCVILSWSGVPKSCSALE